jgi:23S rRNA (guanosine2251-2'-O)-methyltransferase
MKQQQLFGRHPVLDAIKSGLAFEKIFFQQGTRGEFEKELRKYTKENNIPVQMVPKEKLDKMVKGNHQGIVGLVALIPYYRLTDVLGNIYEKGNAPLLLVLDGITDVRNIGAIARTAECMGVDALIVPHRGSGQINPDAVKSSAGALLRMTVCRETSLVNAVESIKLSGIQIVASRLDPDAKKSFEIDFSLPTALILGAEDSGVSHALLKLADQQCIIPQLSTFDSLNVSVAAGMLLYEVTRQRILC